MRRLSPHLSLNIWEVLAMVSTLRPGDTIGILGGGQLGRMIAQAASRMGLKCHIYCPDENSPAFEVSAEKTIASYEDEQALKTFAQSVSVVTYEFENVPGETARILEELVPVRPGLVRSRFRRIVWTRRHSFQNKQQQRLPPSQRWIRNKSWKQPSWNLAVRVS